MKSETAHPDARYLCSAHGAKWTWGCKGCDDALRYFNYLRGYGAITTLRRTRG